VSHRRSYDNKTEGKNRRSRLSQLIYVVYVLNMYLLSKQRWVWVPAYASFPISMWIMRWGILGGLLAPLLIGVVKDRISNVSKVRMHVS